jgi:hypothetical protein
MRILILTHQPLKFHETYNWVIFGNVHGTIGQGKLNFFDGTLIYDLDDAKFYVRDGAERNQLLTLEAGVCKHNGNPCILVDNQGATPVTNSSLRMRLLDAITLLILRRDRSSPPTK